MSPVPSGVRVRAYQVGYGECLLVTVRYPEPLADGRTDRHLLVDFGSGVAAPGGPTMTQLAATLADHCDGHLDVVVVTHRHRDHVGGFGDPGAQPWLSRLEPRLLVRPWTDRPSSQRRDLDEGTEQLLGLLDTVAAHNTAVSRALAADRRVLARRARVLAERGTSDARATAMLDAWVDPDRVRWVGARDVVDVARLLPGVRVEVLGPPTPEQAPGLQGHASGAAGYWLDAAERGALEPDLRATPSTDELGRAKEAVAAPDGLGRPAYLLDALHGAGQRQVLEIVEGFADALDNTSVNLLVTVGERTLLLAGDAQVESWGYALDRAYGSNGRRKDPALRDRLARVDLYKVGQHGSRRATPRRLVDLWRRERPDGVTFRSVLSTLPGGSREDRVPLPELVEALRALGEVHSTADLPRDVWWFDVEMATQGPSAARHVLGEPVTRR